MALAKWTAERAQRDFDELLDQVEAEGTQWIVRGSVTYAVMTGEEYLRLENGIEKEPKNEQVGGGEGKGTV
jgi:hypothetical protein